MRLAVTADPDADARIGAYVAVPLSFGAEAGDNDIGAGVALVDDFQDNVAAGARAAACVVKHEQP